ncbi:MAG: folylpolyglutamate synthase/dihydrofolate synthase family protein [Pseudomonadota bacterium]
MRFDHLEQWLDWQSSIHDKAIDLGLDRVREVADRLDINKIADKVITVAGTNGKGSTVAMYETWLRNAGYQVASYTSPHLLRYNERIKRNLSPVADTELCDAFESIEQARQQTALTYFEYGTLAALYLMQKWQPDFAILEVGLGGRLDAVNIIDADLVHLTPISLDHQAWLGSDREQIGFEKAGVLRADQNVVVNDPMPPATVRGRLKDLNCSALFNGPDFGIDECHDGQFNWECNGMLFEFSPVLPGTHQVHNLAGVVAGLSFLFPLSELSETELQRRFDGTRIPGRFETVESDFPGKLIIDVGHNQDAAKALAVNLKQLKDEKARVIVLLGMLEDKESDAFVAELESVVDVWWTLDLDCDRGLRASDLAARIDSRVSVSAMFSSPREAFDHALSSLHNQDIMLVTGSFFTVEGLILSISDSDERIK